MAGSGAGAEYWLSEDATVLFADVVDSTRLVEEDEQVNARRVRDLLLALCEAATRDEAAEVLERRGDGVVLRCLNAEVALRVAGLAHDLADRSSRPWPAQHRLVLRIGVHSARLLGDGRAFYGVGMNTAARVAALAQPGETAISAEVRGRLVDGLNVELEDLGDCVAKGSAAPVRVYRVGPASPLGRLLPAAAPSAALGLPTLAVLRFSTGTGDSDLFALGDMLAESVIGRLSGTAVLRVISRLSSAAIRPGSLPLAEIATRLGADHVVHGTVRMVGGRLSVFVELVNAADDHVLWGERLTGTLDDLLQGSSELVNQIAAAVQSRIVDDQLARLEQQPLPSLGSHTLYLGGLGLMHRQTRSDFDHARQIFEHLKERHSRSAVPRAWLAKWHLLRVVQGWSGPQDDDARLAGVEAARALEIAPDHSLCATIQGVVQAYLHRDFGAAQDSYRYALACNPSDALAHLQQAVLSGWLGQGGQAIEHARQALQLSPIDPHLYFMHSLVASAWLGAGDLAQAEAHALRSVRANCMHVSTYRALTIIQTLLGKPEQAHAQAQRVLALSPGYTVAQFRQQTPWIAHPQFADFCQALASAGVPAG